MSENLKKIWNFTFKACDNPSCDDEAIGKNFMDTLKQAKIGFIVILVLISIVYLVTNASNPKSRTLFYTGMGSLRAISDSIVTGIFGALCVLIVYKLRGVSLEIKDNKGFTTPFKAFWAVFGILMMFSIVMELSGANRFLARDDIINGKGIYYKLDSSGSSSEEEIDNSLIQYESGGDPFWRSIGWSASILVLIFLLVWIFKMIALTFHGAVKANNSKPLWNICSWGFWQWDYKWKFVLELFLNVLLNSLPPFIFSKLIRGESLNSPGIGAILTPPVALFLHIMLQLTNNLPPVA